MKVLKILGCVAVALLLMGILYRPGVRVIVSGKALPGVYQPALTVRCAAAAHAAAEEICPGEAVKNYQLVPVLTPSWTDPQALQLTRVLLESYEGVQRVYAIRAGAEQLGAVDNPAEAYRLCLHYPQLPLHVAPIYTHRPPEQAAEVMGRLENYAKNYAGPF